MSTSLGQKQSRFKFTFHLLRWEVLEDRHVLSSFSFSAMQIIDQAEGPNEPTVVKAYDLDGDGDQDVLAGFEDGTVGWFQNQGTGRMSGLHLIGKSSIPVSAVSAGDMDADGDNDVLATLQDGLFAEPFENLGNQDFASNRAWQISSTTEALLADIDGGGDVEQVTIKVFTSVGDNPFHTMFIDIDRFEEPLLQDLHWRQSIQTEIHFPRNTSPMVTHGLADLDGDGDVDVIVAAPANGKITWYANLGDGMLDEVGRDIAVDGSPRLLTTDDLDGDGDEDIVAYHESRHQIVSYKNDVNQVYKPSLPIDLGFDITSLQAADFDNDGYVDLLVSTATDLFWMRNDGNGRFDTPIALNTESLLLSSFSIADFDQDGNLDVVYADQSGDMIAWSESDGSGQLTSQHILTNKHLDHPNMIVSGDFDGDLDSDVLVASSQLGVIRWYENDGQARFDIRSEIDLGHQLVSSVVSADFDNDNDDDFLVSGNSGGLFLIEIDTNGDFLKSLIVEGVHEHTKLYVEDLDKDGDSDAIAIHGDSIVWYENDGAAVFGSPRNIVFEQSNIADLSIDDVDRDGYCDIVYTVPDERSIRWTRNRGHKIFAEPTNLITSIDFPNLVRLSDPDDDGDVDVLVSFHNGISSHQVFWYKNDGGFEKGIRFLLHAGGRLDDVAIEDWDRDGDEDLVSLSNRGMVLHENIGDVRFRSQTITHRPDVVSPTARDFNGDGISDILVGLRDSNSVAWNQLELAREWTGPIPIQRDGPSNVHPAFSGDLDNDGDVDIVVASGNNGSLSWHENHNGNFDVKKLIYRHPGGIRRVSGADFDNDGDLDLVSSSSSDMIWHENVGHATFVASQMLPTASVDIQTVDLDNDGDVDVLSKRNWFENDGGGRFESRELPRPAEGRLENPRPADIDNDGDLDLVATVRRSGGSDVIWMENLSGFTFTVERLIHRNTTTGAIAVADQDGDGYVDVLWATRDSIEIALNVGSGEFADPRRVGRLTRSDDLMSVDANNDGLLDIVVRNGTHWYQNLGDLRFEQIDPSPWDRWTVQDPVDVDGDGVLEFVAEQFRSLAIITLSGSGTKIGQTLDEGPAGAWTTKLVDLDNDSDLDVVVGQGFVFGQGLVSGQANDHLVWHENDGLGNFSQARFVIAIKEHQQVHFADITQNGLVDLVWTDSRHPNDVVMLTSRNESGAYTETVELLELSSNVTLETVDLDRDGDFDIVYGTNGRDWTIGWLENTGDGSFVNHEIAPFIGLRHRRFGQSIFVADLDSDGNLDLLTSQTIDWYESGPILWYRNRGGEVFDDPVDLGGSMPILITDIDGNNRIDIMAFDHEWYEYDGQGRLVKTNRFAVDVDTAPKTSARFSDFDGDGDHDLLVASRGIRWYMNDGNGIFDRVELFAPEAVDINTLAVGDIDGDGDSDLLFANDGGTVTEIGVGWYRNETVASPSGDFNNDDAINAEDIDLLCTNFNANHQDGRFDLNDDGRIDRQDLELMLSDILDTTHGDANLDGQFNAEDFTLALQSGKYENLVARDTTWEQGDWNCDGRFDSTDLVLAFQSSSYSANSVSSGIQSAIALFLDETDLERKSRTGFDQK